MRTCIAFFFLLTGCASSYYPPGSYSPGPPATVWFQARFGVGTQCEEGDWEAEFIRKQEEIKATLTEAAIHVYEEEVIRGATCRGCYLCSAINGRYFFQVHADMEDAVLLMGYSLSEPPPIKVEGIGSGM